MEVLLGLLAVASPFVGIGVALWLTGRAHRRREAARARQVTLTDAIHRELGAVAAPVVDPRGRRGWRVAMAVPIDRPVTVAALVRITARVLDAAAIEIVLTPQEATVWSRAHTAPASGPANDVPLAA